MNIRHMCICRYKSLLPPRGHSSHACYLLSQIGKQLYVLWLYFNKALIFFKMCTYISMYLFHIHVHIGLRLSQFKVQAQVYTKFCSMKELFAQFKELVYSINSQWLCIKLARVTSSAGISFMMRLFGIELAYSHNVLFRLFVGLMEINPVFLLISLCISLVLGILSFYYEYSYLSIFRT